MKSILSLLIIFILIFTFSGCREDPSISDVSSESSSSQEINLDSKIIGIISLGYYEDYNQYIQDIKSSPYLSEYDFLSKLSEEVFISASDGTETFAIIPPDSTASVCVCKLIYDEGLNNTQNGDIVYNSSQAKPIIVKCNLSDIFPDTNIIITYKDGTVTEFSLKCSMKDGKIEITSESSHLIQDLTKYQ